MKVWLDHFVVAIDDLDRGIDGFETRTGTRAAFGGEHPTLGTHNALVSLDHDRYFELIAPRPGATVHPLFQAVLGHDVLTPVLWAVATDDLATLHRLLIDAGFDVGQPTSGSRTTEGGDQVRWTMMMPGPDMPKGSPFFLQWDPETPHPSTTTPRGCTLASYTVASTPEDRDRLVDVFEILDLRPRVDTSAEWTSVTLNTPRGQITFDGCD